MSSLLKIGEIVGKVRELAVDYYKLTGRPLGVTGEIGEYEACRLLNLSIAAARERGFDATDASGRKIQIKSRALSISEKNLGSHRLGSIKLDAPWDVVFLVLMDDNFQPHFIYEANREAITAALSAPGSKARNERGALSISKFKSIGSRIWQRSDR